jgi:hypothetical protein
VEEQQQTFAQEISLNDDDVSKSRLSRIAVLGYLSLLIIDKPITLELTVVSTSYSLLLSPATREVSPRR